MAEISMADATAMLTAKGAPFEMEEASIRGVNLRVWKYAPEDLREIFESTQAHGDKVFLVYEDERMTFAEHYQAVSRLAHLLRNDYGVKKGDRVAIAMRNFPEWPVCFWATVICGAVVVPLNAWWTGHELEYGLADSGAKVLFADGQRVESLVDHFTVLTDLQQVIVIRDGGNLPAGVLRLTDELARVEGTPDLPHVNLVPEDDATIFYTSGTTGQPKGALGTHRNICTNLLNLRYAGMRSMIRRGDIPAVMKGEKPAPAPPLAPLISVPFFHATGCHSTLLSNTAGGNKLVMMYKWDPERAMELIEREKITSFGGVPSMVWQVLESPEFENRDLSSIQSIGYGGAPAAPELVDRIKERFPNVSAGNGYGLTETSSMTSSNSGIDYERKPDSVGVAVAVCDVKLMDADGTGEVEPGAIGELWIKGPNVVKGYWNKPEATENTFTDGWLHTGDLARIDDEGFIYIVDRAKDMLIRGGENVYCVEVENALYEHPAVMDAAVVGVPHKVLGEEVGAVVQVVPGSKLTKEELAAFVRKELAAFMVPQYFMLITDPLPRNANGKILKPEVRQTLLEYLGMAT
ncbi:MAG: class I adenylate-forming enzyme family protein [Pseudomonadales bacterium]